MTSPEPRMKEFLLDVNEGMRREMGLTEDILASLDEAELDAKLDGCLRGIDANSRWAEMLRDEKLRRLSADTGSQP